MNAVKPQTDNAIKNKLLAFSMLDSLEELSYSKTSMIDELTFNFGYTPDQAQDVYDEWCKQP